MIINYITAVEQSQPLSPTIWLFEISQSDYFTIQTNPNVLNINYDGTLINVNDVLYATSNTPPYNNLWKLYYNTTTNKYYLSFVKNYNSYFDDINKWRNFDGVFSATNQIVVTDSPQSLMPGYNPISFGFYSNKFAREGFRYLVTVHKGFSSIDNQVNKIGSFKIVPAPDGKGYIDIQKLLASNLSVDFNSPYSAFNAYTNLDNAEKSHINYTVFLGEEYTSIYPYSELRRNEAAGIYLNYTILKQTNPSIIHNYQVGDQINISTITTGATATINGLHTVVLVPNNTSFCIDVPFPDPAEDNIYVSGTTRYANNKKEGYLDLQTITNLVAFNGGLDDLNYKVWSGNRHTVKTTPDNPDDLPWLLTSLKSTNIGEGDFTTMLTPSQNLLFNYMVEEPSEEYSLRIMYHQFEENVTLTNYLILDNAGPYSYVKQFYIGASLVSTIPKINDTLSFVLTNNVDDEISQTYRFNMDVRCAIEDYQVMFMDRMGSVLSIPFYLRSTEKMTITRDVNKIANIAANNTLTDLAARGSNINNVNIEKKLELNTNWMNNAMLELYEEMISSPYTWIKIRKYDKYANEYRYDYYSCVVEDKEYEMTKQKNKKLIRKSVMITMANQQPINI